jgi:hypothetical protein
MAILTGQNIGANQRGILNLGATINTPLDTTLRNVTDGMGNNSPLQLSTASVSFGGSTGLNWDNANTRLGIGTNTPLGILHLKTAAATTRLLLDGDAAQSKIITYRTAGLQRFGLYANNTAESGANAGSDFAIRAYSDAGTLLSTPIFIKRSTGNVSIGQTSGTAKLTIKGTGDVIAAFLSNSGAQVASISDNGTIACQFLSVSNQFSAISLQSNTIVPQVNGDITIQNTWAGSTGVSIRTIANKAQVLTITPDTTNTLTTGTSNIVNVLTPFAPTSGTGVINAISVSGIINQTGGANGITRGLFINPTLTSAADFRAVSTNFTFAAPASSSHLFRGLDLNYTINNGVSQTGTATGIFLNATETALNGMGHNLLDLQVGEVSRFRVDRLGAATFASSISTSGNIALFNNWAIFSATSNGRLALYDSSGASFGLLQFGGTTNAFPAIKRNGAAIDFRLADDSAFCRVDIGSGSRSYGEYRFCDTAGNNGAIFYGQGLGNGLRTFWMNGGQILFSGWPGGGLVSAAIQIDSTTQGFLPSRMTTTQKNAITTPATGLVLYDSTLNKLCVYTGSAWETITSV